MLTPQEHTHTQSSTQQVDDGGAKTRKLIWRTFWILLIVTGFEVGIAFTSFNKELLKMIFIGLTIVKAYYIVGVFMHLKHERLPFAWTILLPFVLIVYFIYMSIYEGNAFHYIRTVVEGM